jgi:hypothetical protein
MAGRMYSIRLGRGVVRWRQGSKISQTFVRIRINRGYLLKCRV